MMASYARETLKHNVVAVIFEEYQLDTKIGWFTMIQVTAHFYDVRKAIEIARRFPAESTELGSYKTSILKHDKTKLV